MKIQAVRGMQDLLPEKQKIFRHVDDVVRRIFSAYGYSEVDFPVIEYTQLFSRSVGEATDIVEKEMYTFDDRSGDSVTLRPEGTAGCVRMAQENGLLFNQIQRLWYSGPMFRYERPQKGRYRQFSQVGGECFGMAGPDIDAELLFLTARIWQELGVADQVTLELNSMGSVESRKAYERSLVEFLSRFRSSLDPDSQRRLDSNPLRILDSKDPNTQAILSDAPVLIDFLDRESTEHFAQLRQMLDDAQMAYEVNPTIVRGLDYYNRTVFEWTTRALGAQGTVCGGGRYDGLVEQLGGRPTPAVGFAMGLDRLALLMLEQTDTAGGSGIDVFIASMGDAARARALLLGEQLRDQFQDVRVQVHCGGGKFKAQLKKADQSGAQIALILGEDEVKAGEITVKNLRDESDQYRITGKNLDKVIDKIVLSR
ncbi:MAG: histidine--tRNA ligase [Gammaproteobacteria bacterium]|nr:histidine--tRNA ligase [Gammaproteobacteria bacterium]